MSKRNGTSSFDLDPYRVSRRHPHLRPLGTRNLKPLELLARLIVTMKGSDPPGVVKFTAWCVAVESHGYDSAKVLLSMEENGWMRLCQTSETKTPMVVLTKEGMKL